MLIISYYIENRIKLIGSSFLLCYQKEANGCIGAASTKKSIILIIVYTKNTDIVAFSPFTNYKTGKEYKDNTKYYWKPFSEFLFSYIDHNDGKYEGDIGEQEGNKSLLEILNTLAKSRITYRRAKLLVFRIMITLFMITKLSKR